MITTLKKRALHRSKIIEGQFKSLVQAIDDEEYCVDILTQSLAIQKSLASLNKLILENHLRTHIMDAAHDTTRSDDDVVAELLRLYELHNVRGKEVQ